MKLRLLLIALLTLTAGCVSGNWPKDSLILDGESTVSTPWGSHTLKAKEVRTGKAAVPAK
jgi:hypothetical protein